MQAEMENRPFTYIRPRSEHGVSGRDLWPAPVRIQFQAGELPAKGRKPVGHDRPFHAPISPTIGDRLAYAKTLEQMRKDLEHLNVGSKINTLSAMDTRAQMQDGLDNARQQQLGAQRDLAAMIAERNGYIQSWHNDVADKLTDALGKLSDARESLNKAQLHRQLVELRAEQDGTVMTISKVSVGSVLNPGQQFITLVPTDAPLEVEANIAGSDDGHVACRRSGRHQVRYLSVFALWFGSRRCPGGQS